ncbi:putative malate dehydrogenase 1B isoform X3 [Zootoca vivipara]|uniref:putative malate dehydrogenase 1B isoform X3 n=1 Tax=Zootoca vivipara TaxID=8524 RepID=UPI00293BB708|nr:putative malate dehydrogenase 1B isoform X3 [Zootoca vivipara]
MNICLLAYFPGKADCPYYAKAELLADYLQKNLPHFRVHKITQHPDNWEKWLQEICEQNGWKHKRSPIIWRELLDRGGKGLLLGGFNDFLEHAQQYYDITSDMMTEEMLTIAKENLQTHIVIDQEEEELKGLINPLHIWINRASASICYHLIPLLINGEIFGMETEISLHLLDRKGCEELLEAIVMEAQDLASPVLRGVTLYTELDDKTFLEAEVIILLDDILQEAIPSFEECIQQVINQCEIYGPLIEKNAKSNVRVVVMGKTFVNLKALMLITHAPSINPQNIVTVSLLLENEAKAMMARKMGMHPAGQFGIPEGIVYSMPVIFQNGSWKVSTDLQISEKNQEYLQNITYDLIREKQVALGEVTELYPERKVSPVPHLADEEESLQAEEEGLGLSPTSQGITEEKDGETTAEGLGPSPSGQGIAEEITEETAEEAEGSPGEPKNPEEENIEESTGENAEDPVDAPDLS